MNTLSQVHLMETVTSSSALTSAMPASIHNPFVDEVPDALYRGHKVVAYPQRGRQPVREDTMNIKGGMVGGHQPLAGGGPHLRPRSLSVGRQRHRGTAIDLVQDVYDRLGMKRGGEMMNGGGELGHIVPSFSGASNGSGGSVASSLTTGGGSSVVARRYSNGRMSADAPPTTAASGDAAASSTTPTNHGSSTAMDKFSERYRNAASRGRTLETGDNEEELQPRRSRSLSRGRGVAQRWPPTAGDMLLNESDYNTGAARSAATATANINHTSPGGALVAVPTSNSPGSGSIAVPSPKRNSWNSLAATTTTLPTTNKLGSRKMNRRGTVPTPMLSNALLKPDPKQQQESSFNRDPSENSERTADADDDILRVTPPSVKDRINVFGGSPASVAQKNKKKSTRAGSLIIHNRTSLDKVPTASGRERSHSLKMDLITMAGSKDQHYPSESPHRSQDEKKEDDTLGLMVATTTLSSAQPDVITSEYDRNRLIRSSYNTSSNTSVGTAPVFRNYKESGPSPTASKARSNAALGVVLNKDKVADYFSMGLQQRQMPASPLQYQQQQQQLSSRKHGSQGRPSASPPSVPLTEVPAVLDDQEPDGHSSAVSSVTTADDYQSPPKDTGKKSTSSWQQQLPSPQVSRSRASKVTSPANSRLRPGVNNIGGLASSLDHAASSVEGRSVGHHHISEWTPEAIERVVEERIQAHVSELEAKLGAQLQRFIKHMDENLLLRIEGMENKINEMKTALNAVTQQNQQLTTDPNKR